MYPKNCNFGPCFEIMLHIYLFQVEDQNLTDTTNENHHEALNRNVTASDIPSLKDLSLEAAAVIEAVNGK